MCEADILAKNRAFVDVQRLTEQVNYWVASNKQRQHRLDAAEAVVRCFETHMIDAGRCVSPYEKEVYERWKIEASR